MINICFYDSSDKECHDMPDINTSVMPVIGEIVSIEEPHSDTCNDYIIVEIKRIIKKRNFYYECDEHFMIDVKRVDVKLKIAHLESVSEIIFYLDKYREDIESPKIRIDNIPQEFSELCKILLDKMTPRLSKNEIGKYVGVNIYKGNKDLLQRQVVADLFCVKTEKILIN